MPNYNLDDENKKLREGLVGFWLEGKFSDLTLKTINGQTFQVHKVVICSISKYFQAMFNSNFGETNKDVVELDKNIKSEDLEFILEFIYTGELKFLKRLDWLKALSLYKTVIFLGMETVQDSLFNYLVHRISNENCLTLLNLNGELYKKLTSKSEDYIRENIQWILQNRLETLKDTEISRILTFKNLNCPDDELYLQLVKWVKINFGDRQKFLKDIFSRINFENLRPEFIQDNILNDNILRENHDFFEKIIAIAQNLCTKLENIYNFQSHCQYYYALNEYYYRVLITEFSFFKIHMEQKEIIELNNFKMEPRFSATEFKENKIFISGGIGSNKCQYFANETFYPLPSMAHERNKHSSINCNGKIYCCGGSRDSNTVTEIFDLNYMKWIQGPTMVDEMYSSGIIKKGAVLYAFNVATNNTEYNELIQRYDTRTDYWEKLSKPISFQLKRTRAIVYKDKIFVLTLYCCFVYNIESNKLNEICKFPLTNPFNVFKFRDGLYLFGKLHSTKKFTCLKFNDQTNEFENYADFPELNYCEADLNIF